MGGLDSKLAPAKASLDKRQSRPMTKILLVSKQKNQQRQSDEEENFKEQMRYFVMRMREDDAAIENLAKETANDLDIARLVRKVNESDGMTFLGKGSLVYLVLYLV